jgi:hypothetical protein
MLKNAYTDAPELHPNLVLSSLHLLFWLLFHPAAWSYHIARLDPALQPDFTLSDLGRTRWRRPLFRRLLLQVYLILPLLVGLPVSLILSVQSGSTELTAGPAAYVVAIMVTLALMVGAVVSVAAGMVSSVGVGIAVGIIASWVEDDALVVPLAIGIALGVMGNITSHLAGSKLASPPSQPIPAVASRVAVRRTQVGGIVIGVLIGVIAIEGVRFGLTSLASLTVGLSAEIGYWLARAIVVGISFGLALGWRRGLTVGLVGGLSAGLAYGLAALGVNSNLGDAPGGLAAGLLFGTSFGVTVTLPYVLAAQIAGPEAGAWAGALGSWGRHIFRNEVPLWPALPLGLGSIVLGFTWTWWRPIFLYPVTAAWNLILFRLDQRRAGRRSLLRWHSAFWDEWQRLPLAGLDEHLLLVISRHQDEGQAALAYLGQSRQRWAAQAVQIELEARRLESAQDITAVGQVHHHLASGALTGPASALLRHFSRLSQDVEAALKQTTAYHQRLALSSIEDRLNGLLRELTASSEPYAARFYPIAGGWQQLVANYGRGLAGAVERSQELDNPYVVGVPLTEQQEIFVGRTDIVARIEQLLLDRRRPPLLLYGQRRMGKTSLLRNLGRLLPSTMIPLFVDGQRIALAGDYPDFLHNLAAEMSRSAQKQRSLRLPALSRENLAASPFTCFNDWLDEVERTLEGQGYSIALLALDEFEMLDSVLHKGRFDEADVLSLLRHMIQHRPPFKVMLAGSHSLEEFQNWASYLINVQVIKIGYLEPDETRQLVERPSPNFALRYEPEASQRVLELTRGHPALVQLLCYELVTLKNEQEAAVRRLARLADVEAAVPRVLASGAFFFGDIQQNQLEAAGLALLRCLARQGEGVVVSREALTRLAGLTVDLERSLALLLRRDLIETANGGYRFQVELIRRWFEAAS